MFTWSYPYAPLASIGYLWVRSGGVKAFSYGLQEKISEEKYWAIAGVGLESRPKDNDFGLGHPFLGYTGCRIQHNSRRYIGIQLQTQEPDLKSLLAEIPLFCPRNALVKLAGKIGSSMMP